MAQPRRTKELVWELTQAEAVTGILPPKAAGFTIGTIALVVVSQTNQNFDIDITGYVLRNASDPDWSLGTVHDSPVAVTETAGPGSYDLTADNWSTASMDGFAPVFDAVAPKINTVDVSGADDGIRIIALVTEY